MSFGVDLSLLAYLNRCGIHFHAVPISISPGRSRNDDNTLYCCTSTTSTTNVYIWQSGCALAATTGTVKKVCPRLREFTPRPHSQEAGSRNLSFALLTIPVLSFDPRTHGGHFPRDAFLTLSTSPLYFGRSPSLSQCCSHVRNGVRLAKVCGIA